MPLQRSPSKFIRSNMDRLRRSLRESFRRRSGSGSPSERHVAGCGTGSGGDGLKPKLWSQDEATVRAGTCTFTVKYLGSVEVGESRGMQICEEALKMLRASRRRTVKGVLYVSGDGLRVVDSESKGLVVDQTIEKVSFCAPDRNHERGFAYICRDGTTRRWMCHGFHAAKDSGERLSHAVGCAFAVCLERKQKRDREAQQTQQLPKSHVASSNTTPSHVSVASVSSSQTVKDAVPFQRQSSFRQAPLNERLQDPQNVKPAEKPPVRPAINPHAVARPVGNRHLFERQGSLRMPQVPLKQQTPNVKNSSSASSVDGNQEFFKRFNSLRLNQLPSNVTRFEQTTAGFGQSAILEEEGTHPSDGVLFGKTNFYGAQSNSSYFSPPASELGSPHSQTRSISFDAPLTNGQSGVSGKWSEIGGFRGGSVDIPATNGSHGTNLPSSSNNRPRGQEWLETAAKQAKLLQQYRASPPVNEQCVPAGDVSTNVSGPPAPSFPPPPLPPISQNQSNSPLNKSLVTQSPPPAAGFGAESTQPVENSSENKMQVDSKFQGPAFTDFDAKWNALTTQQSETPNAQEAGELSRNPFSQESAPVNI